MEPEPKEDCLSVKRGEEIRGGGASQPQPTPLLSFSPSRKVETAKQGIPPGLRDWTPPSSGHVSVELPPENVGPTPSIHSDSPEGPDGLGEDSDREQDG